MKTIKRPEPLYKGCFNYFIDGVLKSYNFNQLNKDQVDAKRKHIKLNPKHVWSGERINNDTSLQTPAL